MSAGPQSCAFKLKGKTPLKYFLTFKTRARAGLCFWRLPELLAETFAGTDMQNIAV